MESLQFRSIKSSQKQTFSEARMAAVVETLKETEAEEGVSVLTAPRRVLVDMPVADRERVTSEVWKRGLLDVTAGEEAEPAAGQAAATVETSISNLLTHLPAEATALYIAGLSVVEKTPLALTIVAGVSLIFLLVIRILAKAKPAVLVTSSVAFVIWVYALGDGPFQAWGLDLPMGLGAFLVIAYSTLITILANAGLIGAKSAA